jgi:predicted nucleic acid-binding protein
MIQIPLTPEQFQSKAAQIAAQQGIKLTGHEGIIEKMGVKAAWVYEDGVLKITILDKPFFMSEQMVEEQLKKLL